MRFGFPHFHTLFEIPVFGDHRVLLRSFSQGLQGSIPEEAEGTASSPWNMGVKEHMPGMAVMWVWEKSFRTSTSWHSSS